MWAPPGADTAQMAYLFYPGSGEVITNISGKSAADLTAPLYTNNLLSFIRNGYKPGFIYAAVQPGESWPTPAEIAANIRALKAIYPHAKIVLTGLSLGAYTVANFALSSQANADMIDGLIIMSTAPVVSTVGAKYMNDKPVLGFVGTADKTAFWSHTPIMNAISAAGGDAIDIIDGSGHGGWSAKYDPDFTVPGTTGNIYDYMRSKLIAEKDTAVIAPPTPVRKLISVIRVYDNAGVIETEIEKE